MIWSDTVRIKCTSFNPENPNTIVIGTDNSRTPAGWDDRAETPWFHRSTNGGTSWSKVYFNGPGISEKPNSAKYILIDPSDTLKIYVGTENTDGGGMYISHNNGDEWMNINLFGTNENVYALACTPAGYADHTLCAISYDTDVFDRTLLISKDFGMTWEEKHPPTSFDLLDNVNRESILYISKDYPKYIYVGAEYFLNNKFIIAAVTPRKLLDVSKLNSLGWKAQIDLEDGIKTTYAWFCEKYGEF